MELIVKGVPVESERDDLSNDFSRLRDKTICVQASSFLKGIPPVHSHVLCLILDLLRAVRKINK